MPKHPAIPLISKFVARLRFPQLFFLASTLFLLDAAIPDFIPFIDEILFAVLAVLFGMWQDKDQPGSTADVPRPREKDITPKDRE